MVSSLGRFAFSMINENAGGCKGEAQTPPSSLRDATVRVEPGATAGVKPHRHPCGMPPVRVAAPSVHIVQSTRVLLAAAPTTPPCFRRWRRSSSLPSRGGFGKEDRLYAMPRAPLLVGAVAAGDWGVQPAAAAGVKPHRHCFAMPPPLVGAALAKRASFTPCQGPHY